MKRIALLLCVAIILCTLSFLCFYTVKEKKRLQEVPYFTENHLTEHETGVSCLQLSSYMQTGFI